LAISAVFFALYIYEVQRNDSNFISSFSINNNKLAFALEDTAIEKVVATSSSSSPPILANPPILNVPGDNYVESTNSAGTHVNFIVTATAGLPLSVPPNSDTVDMDTQRQQQQL
jgi:hypothetical protein